MLDALRQTNCITEVNTRGLYKKRHTDFYPSVSLLKRIKELNLPVTISADAHKPSEIDLYFTEAAETLKEIGLKVVFIFNGSWTPVGLDDLLVESRKVKG